MALSRIEASFNAPKRLFAPTAVTTTGAIVPIVSRGASTCTACSHGDRPTICPRRFPGFSKSTSMVSPRMRELNAVCCFDEKRLQAREPLRLHFFRHLFHLRRRRSGARRILERIGARIADFSDEAHRVLEVGVRLAGEADDEIAGEREVRPRRAKPFHEAKIEVAVVPAVHRGEDSVGARLHREVQIGHQLWKIAMRFDQIVGHVARMARRVAQPFDALDLRQPLKQLRERPRCAPFGLLAVIGVHVLPEQHDFLRAALGEELRLRDDLFDRSRSLRAARVRNDAEGAELVAALLHGEEGGDRHRPVARSRAVGLRTIGRTRRQKMHVPESGFRQVVELGIGRKLGLDRPLSAGEKLRQEVVALRPDHHVNRLRPLKNFRSLRLRDAAGDGDLHLAAMRPRGLFQELAASPPRSRPSPRPFP